MVLVSFFNYDGITSSRLWLAALVSYYTVWFGSLYTNWMGEAQSGAGPDLVARNFNVIFRNLAQMVECVAMGLGVQ